jgi:hypothetical protein
MYNEALGEIKSCLEWANPMNFPEMVSKAFIITKQTLKKLKR